ncbi:BQ5605_C003g01989 [Microbotryum silenes-dioicae]|uniref:BQ5605_C003g01989 protein n=1 Tax=Microbotryum silenes-dioicae TaxID=796604 RepID=A0A2X0MV25_9BASI|nr:BQ5605_C003g01989 [Microbotryum silenes-dioicae]
MPRLAHVPPTTGDWTFVNAAHALRATPQPFTPPVVHQNRFAALETDDSNNATIDMSNNGFDTPSDMSRPPFSLTGIVGGDDDAYTRESERGASAGAAAVNRRQPRRIRGCRARSKSSTMDYGGQRDRIKRGREAIQRNS